MLGSLEISHFAPRVGEQFRICSETGHPPIVDTELIEVTAVGERTDPGSREPFSLVFRGRLDVVLPQRIYRVDHAELGTLEIFLVPLGPGSERPMRYEAVFS